MRIITRQQLDAFILLQDASRPINFSNGGLMRHLGEALGIHFVRCGVAEWYAVTGDVVAQCEPGLRFDSYGTHHQSYRTIRSLVG